MKINSNTIRKLIPVHIFLLIVFLFLWSVVGIPWEIIYIFDLLVCAEFVWALRGIQPTLRRTKTKYLLPWFLFFALYLVLTQLFNFVSPMLAAMAFRRTFRFYLFFLVCAVLLTTQSIEKIMKMLVKLQILNFGLTLFQYFVQELSGDYLGGIFGIENGANAYSNVFLCLICTYMVVKYLEKKEKLLPMLMTIGSALVIAALAELKMFFIEIIVIMLMGILLSRPGIRTVKTIFYFILGFVAAITLLGSIFPEHLAILLDWALFEQYTTEEIAGYTISRLNAFPEINEIFFRDDWLRNLFGYGFGNCEEGSAFFEQYARYKYTWFTHQVTFLETGYVGIIFYISFFVLIFVFSAKSRKVNPENRLYYILGQIISVLCVFWMIYDQSLRREVAFLIFFALAIPVAVRNEWVKALRNVG